MKDDVLINDSISDDSLFVRLIDRMLDFFSFKAYDIDLSKILKW